MICERMCSIGGMIDRKPAVLSGNPVPVPLFLLKSHVDWPRTEPQALQWSLLVILSTFMLRFH
jgi:hypothetical protein